MRLISFLLLLVPLTIAFDDSDKPAYLAFKLKNGKLTRRVEALHEAARSFHIGDPSQFGDVSASFVNTNSLELRLINFFYDETEHRAMVTGILSNASAALCHSFPRQLVFDDYILENNVIKGRSQLVDFSAFNVSLPTALDKHGLIFDKRRERNETIGFVVIRNHTEFSSGSSTTDRYGNMIKPARPMASALVKQPLRASAFVDTVYFCVEQTDLSCKEIGSLKIKKC